MDTSPTDGPIPLMKPAPAPTETKSALPSESVTPASIPDRRPEAGKGSWGGLISIVLIVFIITVAAFYSWGERLATQSAPMTEAETVE